MRRTLGARAIPVVWLLGMGLLAVSGKAGWVSTGPFGGDARSLAADPQDPDRMYLGTPTGQIYLSMDGGQIWNRLTSLQAPSDWVVARLLIDPADTRTVYAAMWSVREASGGIYKSTNAGRSWRSLEGIKGQAVRALAMAPSRSQVLVAGTLEGVFRSEDGGATWKRISPIGHAEIRQLESVAIDTHDPDVIYAGTWHLPWKTTDGGATWHSIAKGMIDDSDVFSIVVDPAQSSTVYATACTGIYRSDNGGAEWRKIQGIPYSSRRTHTLVVDPSDTRTLYAGTTEGLWRTRDGGQSWSLLTSKTWTINAIVLDPRDTSHVYLGMEHAGVMESYDRGGTFRAANRGFVQRQVARIVPDPGVPGRLYAAVLHDGEFGGVFVSKNDGTGWEQMNTGPQGRDVLSLLVVSKPSGRLLAGTSDGLFEYSAEQPTWKNLSRWELPATTKTGAGKTPAKPAPQPGIWVWDLYQKSPEDPIYAATSAGLFESADGRMWKRLPMKAGEQGVYSVATFGRTGLRLLAATSSALHLSLDGGRNWTPVPLESDGHTKIRALASHPALPDAVLVGTSAGLFRTADGGRSWQKNGHGLPVAVINDVIFSPQDPRYVIVATSAGVFHSQDSGNSYTRLDGAASDERLQIQLLAIHPLDHQQVLGASAYYGLLLHSGKKTVRLTTFEEP